MSSETIEGLTAANCVQFADFFFCEVGGVCKSLLFIQKFHAERKYFCGRMSIIQNSRIKYFENIFKSKNGLGL